MTIDTFTISFLAYTALTVAVGVYAARFAKRSDEDYFLAGRTLGPWVAALSASASSSSGWVTMGLVGMAFASGLQAYWVVPGVLLGFLFNWFVLAGPLRDRAVALGAITLPDLFAMHFPRYGPALRILSVLVILVAMFLYVASQLAAAGKAFEASFDSLDYGAGVLVGAGVVLAYTVVGGFRAVCWTDFIQALLMVGALVIFPVYMLVARGGYTGLTESLAAADPNLVRAFPDGSVPALIGFLLGSRALGINVGYPGQPHVLVRFMALRDRRDAIIGGVVSTVWALLVFWGAVTIGILARAATAEGAAWGLPLLAGDGANETALLLAADNMLSGAVSGLVLAAVLAAICSTADSQLVVAASSLASDIYARMIERKPTPGNATARGRTSGGGGGGTHVWINRLTVLALGLGAAAVVFDQRVTVYSYVLIYGWAILGAAFGPQVILLLFWKRATGAGALAGMATGFLVALIWPEVYDPAPGPGAVPVYNLPVAFVAALVVNTAVSAATGSSHRNNADA